MDQLLTDNVWEQVSKIIDPSSRKRAAIAYVSSDNILDFKQGDLLLCDASDHAIKYGETKASALEHFLESGVELYSYPNLHAKTVVFGDQDYVLIGSANLSVSSAENLRELSLLSDNLQIVSQAIAFIHALKRSATPIDNEFIRRVSEIKVERVPYLRIKREAFKQLGYRVWVVSAKELERDVYQDEKAYVEKGERQAFEKLPEHSTKLSQDGERHVFWIRITGKSRFRRIATEGDTIIVILESIEGDVGIFKPTPIILRQDQDNWTRFYYESSSDFDAYWESFQEKITKLGITHIKKSSVKELKADEFALIRELFED